ncbi:MAG TPA: ThiF family adenylyltransferase [Phycisphaerae bacterium]|nr:ThiF family adenylyltransferase [Phycisphaerae bacterium]
MPETDTPATEEPDPRLARYSRQMLFEAIGHAGQKRLQHAQVALIGCGALGSVLANTLVRGGVGFLRIVDRDFIELDNLQRQVLFDEHDIAQNLPKAEAAARKLRKINSAVEIDPVVADANPANIEGFCAEVDLILDGTDNFETRFLINDAAVKHGVPWVYGACLAAEGLVMPVLPHETACLRCIWEAPPPPGTTPTCDTVGVLASVVNIVASLQAVEALKILTGRLEDLNRKLLTIDAWRGTVRAVNMQSAHDQGDCRCCKHGEYEFLSGERASYTTTLCGRNAVQLLQPAGTKVNFKQIAARLGARTRPRFNEYMLRFAVDDYQITLFPDGRAIIQGTADAATARGVYAKYIGT